MQRNLYFILAACLAVVSVVNNVHAGLKDNKKFVPIKISRNYFDALNDLSDSGTTPEPTVITPRTPGGSRIVYSSEELKMLRNPALTGWPTGMKYIYGVTVFKTKNEKGRELRTLPRVDCAKLNVILQDVQDYNDKLKQVTTTKGYSSGRSKLTTCLTIETGLGFSHYVDYKKKKESK
jgi:hypothetical protein